MDLEDLRRSYEESSLELADLMECPFAQFESWFEKAQSSPNPDWLEINAMTLATSEDNHVTARIVLLKQVSQEGFVFFTNYKSTKGKQLASNPQASLVFYWPHIERQIRVEGTVAKTSADISNQYFHARPPGSQLGAIASPQSSVIESREDLVTDTIRIAEENGEKQVPRPDYWGGYCLSPVRIEFWQGRPSRLHDRFVYNRQDCHSAWSVSRLAP
ncbi:MAG: pyridoxamine 5'-phosphate oxidase [Planctomycetota bacterium]